MNRFGIRRWSITVACVFALGGSVRAHAQQPFAVGVHLPERSPDIVPSVRSTQARDSLRNVLQKQSGDTVSDRNDRRNRGAMIGGFIGMPAGILHCALLGSALGESSGFHFCTAKGSAISAAFGLSVGLAVGGLVTR